MQQPLASTAQNSDGCRERAMFIRSEDRWRSFAQHALACFFDGEGAGGGGGDGTGDGTSTTTKNSDGDGGGDGGKPKDDAIPKTRFDEVVAERNRLRQEKADREQKEREAEEERAKKQGEWEKLATTRAQESEDLKKQLKERDERERQLIVKYEVMLGAKDAGIVDPEAAYKLMDTSKLEVKDGKLADSKAFTDALKELTRERPWLLDDGKKQQGRQGIPGTPGGDGGAGGGNGTATAKPLQGYMERTYGGLVKRQQ
jgi:hypothetical protein